MAEALKIKINSDSSELRSDIDKNIKKMMELSNKYKEVNDKLDQRGPEDFAKSLSSALEEVDGKLDKANQKLKDTEEEYNKAAQKAHELSGGKDQDAYDKALASQQKAEEKMNAAKSDVESLDAQKAEIVRQTTNEYNAQTDALQLQAQELQSQFSVLSAINDVDMSDLGTTELLEKVNKIGTAASSMWSNFKSGASNVFGKIKSFASSCAEKVKGIFNKKTFDGANSGLKSLVGTAGQFTMALLGARGAFTLIRKAVSQILEDNQTLANTVNTIWNSVVSLIAPAVNAIVSVFATILNYVVAIISYISSLDVLGLMKKAQKKATSSTGSSGSSSSKKKQQQQYSFDTAETIQKQDDSSSGGASGAVDQVNDSYLKGIELSDTLLRWAEKLKAIWQDIQQIGANLWEGIKEGLKYMNSGQRILNTCVKLVDAILDDIKECTAATVEWSANLNFGPFFDALATMLESLEPILEKIGDLFVFLYTNALLPIAKWALECALPQVLKTVASALDTVYALIEAATPGLENLWNQTIKPLGEYLGGKFVSILQTTQKFWEDATERINENQDAVSDFISVFDSISPVIENLADLFEFLYNEAILPISQWIAESALPQALETISSVLDTISALIEAIKPVLQEIWDNVIKPLGEYLGDTFIGILETLQDWCDSATQWINDNQETVAVIAEVITAIAEAIGIVVGVLVTLGVILETVNTVMTVTTALFTLLTSPITLVAAAIVALIAIIVLLVQHWDEVKEAASNCWNSIVDTFQSAWQWFNDNVITPIAEGFKGMVNSIIGWAEGMANAIISGVENAVNAVIDIINSISFDIPSWVPGIGGSHFGMDLSHVNYGRVSIPRLAKGAVIPPNQEFLAVLGDQTRGKNIETPESLLREIVQEESGTQEINIVAQGEMSQLIKLLKLKLQEEDKRVGSSLIVGG